MHNNLLGRYLSRNFNVPEEDDETMSTGEREATVNHKPESTFNPDEHGPLAEQNTFPDDSLLNRQRLDREQEHKPNTLPQPGLSYCSYQPHHSLPAGYGQPTPFPSQAEGTWFHPSFASSWSGYPNSMPSCLNQKDHSGSCGESFLSGYKLLSLTSRDGTSMSSLEQPLSLHSNLPTRNHTLSPYWCPPQGSACCAQCPAEAANRGPVANKHLWPHYHLAHSGPYCKSANCVYQSSHVSSALKVLCLPHDNNTVCRNFLYSIFTVSDQGDFRHPGPRYTRT